MFKINAKFKFNKKNRNFNHYTFIHVQKKEANFYFLSFSSSVTMTYQEGTFLQVVNSPYRKGLIISVRKAKANIILVLNNHNIRLTIHR
ncbi:MAG: hypothetical protein Ct9H90mP28_0380 [Paracoccaceae bacterium]|nr:MAG: hypothetical protein Ct9H90mP28_0380 [Paracoccaceae bacterium]